jgi:hypothetical protein
MAAFSVRATVYGINGIYGVNAPLAHRRHLPAAANF